MLRKEKRERCEQTCVGTCICVWVCVQKRKAYSATRLTVSMSKEVNEFSASALYLSSDLYKISIIPFVLWNDSHQGD